MCDADGSNNITMPSSNVHCDHDFFQRIAATTVQECSDRFILTAVSIAWLSVRTKLTKNKKQPLFKRSQTIIPSHFQNCFRTKYFLFFWKIKPFAVKFVKTAMMASSSDCLWPLVCSNWTRSPRGKWHWSSVSQTGEGYWQWLYIALCHCHY